MLKSLLRIGALCLLGAAVAGAPASLLAQTTNKPAASKPAGTETKEPAKADKKPVAGPFHGKLAALDKTAKTITVGKRTFQITSATRINKAGKPATLQDGVVGEEVSGYVKPNDEGKLVATTVNFGPKAAKPAEAKPSSAAKEQK